MTSTTLTADNTKFNGTLEIRKNHKPTFGKFVLDWLFFWAIKYIALTWGWSVFSLFVFYLTLFTAITTTVRILFTPKYQAVFIPQPKLKTNPTDDSTQTTTMIKETTRVEPSEKAVADPLHSSIGQSEPKINEVFPTVSPLDGGARNDAIYCSQCGEKLDTHTKFCPRCGNPAGH